MTGSDLNAHLTLLGLTHALQDQSCGTYLPFSVCIFVILIDNLKV